MTRFSLKGEILEMLPLAVRAAILRIRPNYAMVYVELHYGICLPFSLSHVLST
jgi:hypothetical protein